MKRILILAAFFPMYLSIATPATTLVTRVEIVTEMDKEEEYERFACAVAFYESSNNPTKVGTADDCGLYQITPIRLRDFNQRTGEDLTREDLFDPTVSRRVFDYYSKGKPFEQAAREWNGGPRGMSKISTIKYWAAIVSILKTY